MDLKIYTIDRKVYKHCKQNECRIQKKKGKIASGFSFLSPCLLGRCQDPVQDSAVYARVDDFEFLWFHICHLLCFKSPFSTQLGSKLVKQGFVVVSVFFSEYTKGRTVFNDFPRVFGQFWGIKIILLLKYWGTGDDTTTSIFLKLYLNGLRGSRCTIF